MNNSPELRERYFPFVRVEWIGMAKPLLNARLGVDVIEPRTHEYGEARGRNNEQPYARLPRRTAPSQSVSPFVMLMGRRRSLPPQSALAPTHGALTRTHTHGHTQGLAHTHRMHPYTHAPTLALERAHADARPSHNTHAVTLS